MKVHLGALALLAGKCWRGRLLHRDAEVRCIDHLTHLTLLKEPLNAPQFAKVCTICFTGLATCHATQHLPSCPGLALHGAGPPRNSYRHLGGEPGNGALPFYHRARQLTPPWRQQQLLLTVERTPDPCAPTAAMDCPSPLRRRLQAVSYDFASGNGLVSPGKHYRGRDG